ncbi:hypothetical protein F4811DRAFT_389678 [Daldinia bambusicola]|nr:hypothetical protein F4811DRAFT_389678 [Daldinia bambusicola]
MDPRAFPSDLRGKIDWAGNDVLTYHDAAMKMKNRPQLRRRYEDYPGSHGHDVPSLSHGGNRPYDPSSPGLGNSHLPLLSPPPNYTWGAGNQDPRRASYYEEQEGRSEYHGANGDGEDKSESAGWDEEYTYAASHQDPEEASVCSKTEDARSFVTENCIRDKYKSGRGHGTERSWGSNNPYSPPTKYRVQGAGPSSGVPPTPLTAANLSAVPDATRPRHVSAPQAKARQKFLATLSTIPSGAASERPRQHRTDATTSSRHRDREQSEGHRRNAAVDLRGVFAIPARLKTLRRDI